jgi:hypothetical protein
MLKGEGKFYSIGTINARLMTIFAVMPTDYLAQLLHQIIDSFSLRGLTQQGRHQPVDDQASCRSSLLVGPVVLGR